MLDIRLIRERPEEVERALAQKGGAELIKGIAARDAERRRLIHESEELKALRNKASEAIGQAKRRGEDASAEQARMREVSERIKDLDAQLKVVDEAIEELLVQVPNLPHPSVPPGTSDADNVEVRKWGTPRAFSFEPKPHEDVGEKLGLLDIERATKIAKSRFAVLWGPLAHLERALAQFMLDLHTREHGYTELWLPHLVSGETMLKTGQLPKFEEDAFRIEARDLFLVPTAEVPVTNMYREEILPASALPIKHVAWSTNFRSEAGAAGKDTRGYIRLHQFNKVEMVKFVEPVRSNEELELLVKDAEDVLQRLEIPYRLILLCTGDMGFGQSKTYDLEAWSPGEKRFLEVSSCSNYNDFQARRANIRYRRKDGRVDFVHTLNGSGLALPRTMVAIIENYQQEDGTIRVPTALRTYMGGLDVIR